MIKGKNNLCELVVCDYPLIPQSGPDLTNQIISVIYHCELGNEYTALNLCKQILFCIEIPMYYTLYKITNRPFHFPPKFIWSVYLGHQVWKV